ncbi:MAG: bifunctional methionine sulfoxide reductase B/A protein [Phycisphaerales bacterium]
MTNRIALAIVGISLGLCLAVFVRSLPTPTPDGYTMTNAAHANTRTTSESGHDVTPLTPQQVEELAKELSPEDREIVLNKGTEKAFCGTLIDNKKEGSYVCRLCALPLFSSNSKFTSNSGWPSFFQPADKDHIGLKRDNSYGMRRIEILCARCSAHLGHVFDDGPPPTGLRFCVNSASLQFVEKGEQPPLETVAPNTEYAYFAGGCFWGVEDRFAQLPGVLDAVSGYMGGNVTNPTYKQVCSGYTGHAEAVRVRFDPETITFSELLDWFFKFHDPTQLNRQGPDFGTQYRSAIFPASPEQEEAAKRFIEETDASGRFKKKIATTIEDYATFYEAEEYHQDYHAKHGGSCPLPTFDE